MLKKIMTLAFFIWT